MKPWKKNVVHGERPRSTTSRRQPRTLGENHETKSLKTPHPIPHPHFTSPKSWPTQRRNLRPPTPYCGKGEELWKFLQEVKIYLLANIDSYPEDLDKILFVLSYMSEGDANSWKEEYIDSVEQKAAQDNAALNFGDYKTFIQKLTDDFSPYDAPKDAQWEKWSWDPLP